jgi:hypothetical protein
VTEAAYRGVGVDLIDQYWGKISLSGCVWTPSVYVHLRGGGGASGCSSPRREHGRREAARVGRVVGRHALQAEKQVSNLKAK